ncbi:hypothetical protein BC834DRAFT_1034710 [Gloeopeniophorella convolvens]|nr:hypothetical protein BC834DRAFT_1034710 [Gloeopeniophorella convolvens]
MLDGKLSIRDVTQKNSNTYYPFNVLTFWTYLAGAVHARQQWSSAYAWLKRHSEHHQLARKICDLIDEIDAPDSTVQTNAGVLRRLRYSKGTGLVNYLAEAEAEAKEQNNGNARNAKIVADGAGALVVKKRQQAFKMLPMSDMLATAKISMFSPLRNDAFGIVAIDQQLMIAQVITMYVKIGSGKVIRHGWTDKATSVGSLSYIVVQLWEQSRQRTQFKNLHAPTTKLGVPRFAHLSANNFLYTLPAGFTSRTDRGALQVNATFITDVFDKLQVSRTPIMHSLEDLRKILASKDAGELEITL